MVIAMNRTALELLDMGASAYYIKELIEAKINDVRKERREFERCIDGDGNNVRMSRDIRAERYREFTRNIIACKVKEIFLSNQLYNLLIHA